MGYARNSWFGYWKVIPCPLQMGDMLIYKTDFIKPFLVSMKFKFCVATSWKKEEEKKNNKKMKLNCIL